MFGLFKKSEPSNPKLCVDCKHYEQIVRSGYASQTCSRNVGTGSIDLVTGGNRVYNGKTDCGYEREIGYRWRCGPKGRFFEPKENV